MCGIVGFRSKKIFNELREHLPQAVETLSYRGPDDSGLFFDEKRGVGLGHARLAVIDLSNKAHQPMASDDGAVWMSYNGQVYNFKRLRGQLKKKGHSFRSNSDTEVVLKSYLEWGIDGFKKFTGMFSLAIWDGRKGELILARALYRCGDYEGLGEKILNEYINDYRGHYSRHAFAVLNKGKKTE